jgi:ATP-binding cassette subfamily C exporter for protease/lipase
MIRTFVQPGPQPTRRAAGANGLRAAMRSLYAAFAAAVSFSLVSNLLMLVPTLYMLQIYDRVMISQNTLTLIVVTLVTLFLACVAGFSDWMRTKLLVRIGVRLDSKVGVLAFDAGFADAAARGGRGAERALDDLGEVRRAATGSTALALLDAPWVPIYLLVVTALHPFLGAVAVAFAVLQVCIAWFGHRMVEAPARIASQAQEHESAFLEHKLRNAESVDAMGMLGGLSRRWAQRHADSVRLNKAASTRAERIAGLSRFVRLAQQSLALGAGALLVIDGELSPGAMIAANVLMSRTLAPIDQLAAGWRGIASAREAWSRLNALIGTMPLNTPSHRAAPVAAEQPVTGPLELREVIAAAPGRAAPILDRVSLTLNPGEVTVILGPSAAGKSTLARAMLGIWPGMKGAVLLGDRPIGEFDRDVLGRQIGYLPQDVSLFDATVAENIARLATPNSEAVVAAAKAAGLHDFILRLPGGYDARLGAGGLSLSGGQKQRIALARALYGDPALLVLDEPNASLDEAGETALRAAVQAARERGATIALITHRPGAVALADHIAVLAGGRIELSGPRDQVLAAMHRARERTLRRTPA